MDGFNFRSGEAISQQKGIFAVEGHFRSPFCSPFRSYEMRGEAAKWHSCAKWWFRSCENFRRERAWGCEIISQPMGVFAAKA